VIIRKIMLLGAIGVGKTSIANRLAFDTFSGAYKMTVGSNVYRYDVTPSPAAAPFQFLVFDTDGSLGGAIVRETAAAGAHAAMVVGDVTRGDTLDHMIDLAERFQDAFPAAYTAYVLNKLDLLAAGETPALPAKLKSPEFTLFKTSAKTGDQVKAAFHDAARTIARRGL
jgi:GTPase SAR1 family protein